MPAKETAGRKASKHAASSMRHTTRKVRHARQEHNNSTPHCYATLSSSVSEFNMHDPSMPWVLFEDK